MTSVALKSKFIVESITEPQRRSYEESKENKLKNQCERTSIHLLFIIDGAKGLRKGIEKVFSKQAIIQRYQWHKCENIIAYLPKSQQAPFRKKRQKAIKRRATLRQRIN